MPERELSKSHLPALLLALSLLVIFSFAPVPLQAQEKKLVRVVFVSLSWNSEIPVRVAMAKGYFKEQGMTMEPIFVRGGPAAVAALASGDVDFGSIGGAQAIIRRQVQRTRRSNYRFHLG
jgi:NitT/TauT family transport system substrate-binding protein